MVCALTRHHLLMKVNDFALLTLKISKMHTKSNTLCVWRDVNNLLWIPQILDTQILLFNITIKVGMCFIVEHDFFLWKLGFDWPSYWCFINWIWKMKIYILLQNSPTYPLREVQLLQTKKRESQTFNLSAKPIFDLEFIHYLFIIEHLDV